MLGGLFAVLSAATLAFNNVSVRRGVLTGSVAQAIFITVPIGVPLFFLIALASGQLSAIAEFSPESWALLCAAGIVQFVWGRYCNYRATEALGANLAAPVSQASLIISLVLAFWFLGEAMTPLRLLGIALVLIGPVIVAGTRKRAGTPSRFEAKSVGAAARQSGGAPQTEFRPRYLEGYLFAGLCALGFGLTPILVRIALTGIGAAGGVAGGLISYAAATAFVALVLVWPGQLTHAVAVSRTSLKWFTISGVFVCISQMFRYMALASAPVSVVQPLQQTAIVFRVIFGWMLNRQHESFDAWVLGGMFISLLGGVALSVSTELVHAFVPLPEFLIGSW